MSSLFPRFCACKEDREFYIIEVKVESERGDKTVEAQRKTVERLQDLQPDKFKENLINTRKLLCGIKAKCGSGFIPP